MNGKWDMSQKLPVDDFGWVEKTSQFNEDFIKSYNDDSDKERFLEVYVQYSLNLHKLHNDLPYLPERIKIGKIEQLVAIKENMSYTQQI